MRFDHVAIPSKDIPQSVKWYVEHFGAKVLYEDATWAFMQIGGTKVALITPTQHPPHFAMSVTEQALADLARQHGKPVDKHRDGTQGIYVYDPSGNAVELISYPPGETVYAKKSTEAGAAAGD